MLPEPPSPVLYQICLPPKPFCSCLLACFFFPNNNSTLLFFLSLSPTADVTQIRGHIRSSPSPSPLRLLHCIFFSRGKISALSSLADSRRNALKPWTPVKCTLGAQTIRIAKVQFLPSAAELKGDMMEGMHATAILHEWRERLVI